MAGLAAEKGDVEPVVVDTNKTGQTVTLRIFRASDNYFLDWSDNTFKPVGLVVTLIQTLTEIDAVNAPGLYALMTAPHLAGLDTSLLLNLTETELEQLVMVTAASPGGPAMEPGYLKIVPRIDGLVPERIVASRVNSMARGRITLSGAVPKPVQDAVYFDENGLPIFTNRNTGDERNPVP